MTIIKKILVPYDGSKSSQKAFKYAADLASKYNSSVHVLSVVKGPYTGKPYMTEAQEKSGFRSTKEKIQKMHNSLKTTAQKNKIKITTEIKYSESVVEGVLDSVTSKKADFVVVGSRGIAGFKRLLLGSVAAGVCQHAKCPVLIVR